MKPTSRLVAIVLAILCLVAPAVVPTRAVTPPSEHLAEQIKDYAMELVADGYSYYYHILDTHTELYDLAVEGGQYQADLLVSFGHVLKAKDAQEMPFIQGMLDEANVTVTSNSEHIGAEQVLRSDFTESQKDAVAQQVSFWVDEVKSYIGEKQNTNILLRIVGKLNNGQFDAAQASVLAENIDNYIAVEEMFPALPEELQQDGREAVKSVTVKYKGNGE